MSKRALARVLLATTLSWAAIVPLSAQTAGELYNRFSPAVVLIELIGDTGKVKGRGTGFIVSSSGQILTNYHVIAHAKKATVRLANGDAYDTVEVLDVDQRKDIALLKIKAIDLPTVVIGNSSQVHVGDTVLSLSNPLGLQNTLSSGIVGGIRSMDGYKYFQVSTPISHGSSGGPLFNVAGQVVGITTALIEEGQNLNFAVPIDYAKGILASPGAPKSLAAVYEPEAEPPKAAAKSDVGSLAEGGEQQVSAAPSTERKPQPSEDLRKQGPYFYIQTKFGKWSLAEARLELGDPIRQTSLDRSDVYVFKDPSNLFREVTLFFDHKSKALISLSVYPWNLSWRQCKETLGEKYWKKKTETGTTYMYKDKPVNVYVDDREQVTSIGTFCNSCAE